MNDLHVPWGNTCLGKQHRLQKLQRGSPGSGLASEHVLVETAPLPCLCCAVPLQKQTSGLHVRLLSCLAGGLQRPGDRPRCPRAPELFRKTPAAFAALPAAQTLALCKGSKSCMVAPELCCALISIWGPFTEGPEGWTYLLQMAGICRPQWVPQLS